MQLEIEESALRKESDKLSMERKASIEKELAELNAKFNEMKAQLENEKKKIVGVQETKAEIDKVNLEIEEAKRSYDFTRAAELQYGKLPELQKRLEEAESKAGKHENSSLLRDEVTADEIAKIVAKWTWKRCISTPIFRSSHLPERLEATSRISPNISIAGARPSMSMSTTLASPSFAD